MATKKQMANLRKAKQHPRAQALTKRLKNKKRRR
jgi:hypothetical protein